MVSEPRTPRARIDAYHERTDYHDDGCELAPSCLACPLPVCKYDVGGALMLRNILREARIAERRRAGATINTIAG